MLQLLYNATANPGEPAPDPDPDPDPIPDPGPGVPRNIRFNGSFDSGKALTAGNVDHWHIDSMTSTPIESLNIVGISKADPGRIEFDAPPTHLRAYRLEGVGGMVELEGRMIRTKNISGNFADLYEDHAIPGFDYPGTTAGQFAVDTSGFTAFTSGGVGGRYRGTNWLADNKEYASTANSDWRIVTSCLSTSGETITPLRGTHFCRASVSYTKDYFIEWSQPRNKPRGALRPPTTGGAGVQGQMQYDVETWLSVSWYIPLDWQDETADDGTSSVNMLIAVSEDGGSSGAGFIKTFIATPNGKSDIGGFSRNASSWIIEESHSDTSVNSPDYVYTDAGRVTDDAGMWTTFIYRMRANPYSVQTNASQTSGGMDQIFEGNKGILQVWKSQGPEAADRSRNMVLIVDKVNQPMGAVPRAGYRIKMFPRMYRYGWHRYPTTQTHDELLIPIDEYRWGETIADGTGYTDVDPFQRAQP